MGVELAASIVGLTLLGLWIDYRWECKPTGVLIGAGLGVVGGLYNFIRQALRLGREGSAPDGQSELRQDDDTRP
jgi:F0F1-type ATP synthase assembly protein I